MRSPVLEMEVVNWKGYGIIILLYPYQISYPMLRPVRLWAFRMNWR
jgi:hypothetical protein